MAEDAQVQILTVRTTQECIYKGKVVAEGEIFDYELPDNAELPKFLEPVAKQAGGGKKPDGKKPDGGGETTKPPSGETT